MYQEPRLTVHVTLLVLLVLSACTTPTSHSNIALSTYDKDTEYGIQERSDGFAITVYYSRYQFIPESSAVAAACKSQLTSIAWEHADKVGREIEPMNEQRVRVSMGRNGLSGVTSCQAYAEVEWATDRRGSNEPSSSAPIRTQSGTGFVVSPKGYILTNNHVVEDCRTIHIKPDNSNLSVAVAARDAQNDLALLKMAPRFQAAAVFRSGDTVRPGESVIAIGFPLTGLLAAEASVTVGTVSALAGVGNDARFLQMTTAVQPGNSGGPLLDQSGNVVGIVVGKLDALRVAEITGDIPQNVNFAIKAGVARSFLDAHGIDYDLALSQRELTAADVAERARQFTVLIECRQ